MRYIIYCRKSTDTEDKQILSLDSQERELLDIAKKHNLNVIKVYRESMSAKSVGRPIFNKALKQVENGKADAIICWKLDRLARNFIDGGKVIDSLQRNVIKEIRTIEGSHTPADNVLLLAVQLGMANQYIRDLSVNVKRGNREKLSRGEWPNHAPFGYLNDKATKTIVVDHAHSKYVPRIFNLYLTGSYSLRQISNHLYSEGLRTSSGKKVYSGQIHRILSRIFYTGIMERDGKHYKGNHTPLITREMFLKTQDLLRGKSRPRTQKQFFPLRGFLKCQHCGCAFTSSVKKSHHYYYCTNGRQNCEAHKSYMREILLYDEIAKLFNCVAFSERKIDLMYKSAKERMDSIDDYSSNVIESLQSELKSLPARESKLLDIYLAEQIPEELYTKKVKALQNERVALEKQLNEVKQKQPSQTLEQTRNVFLEANKASKEFLGASDVKKRQIVESLLWNLTIENKNIARVSLKSPYDIMYKAPKNASISTLLPD